MTRAAGLQTPASRTTAAGQTPQGGRRWPIPPVTGGLLATGFLLPQVVTDPYLLGLLVAGLVLGLAALAVGFLADRLGLYTFGIGAFYGSGAYGFAVATKVWAWPPHTALLFAVGGSAVLAAVVGAMIVRLPVIAFLMVTLALTQMCAQLAELQTLRPYLGGDDGVTVTFDGPVLGLDQADLGPDGIWPVLWAAVAGTVLVLHLIRRSRYGALLRGIRENEERMRFAGFATYAPRVAAFTLAGVIAAVAGVLHALSNGFVTPDIVGFAFAGSTIVAALVGGTGTLFGPLAGAVLYTFAQSALSTSGNLTLLMGLGIAAVVVFLPGGLGGLARTAAGALRRTVSKGVRHARH